jgi:rRNA maturation RNase YbeY
VSLLLRCSRTAGRVGMRLNLRGEVGITFVTDSAMLEFGHGKTDVLAFPYGGSDVGDIFINLDYLARTRKLRDQHRRCEELLVHALVHLNGYTHWTFESYTRMRNKEIEVFGRACLPKWQKYRVQ